MELPSMPDWEHIHPLIVHFPVVLLTFAPVLAVAAVLFRKIALGLLWAAFFLILAGTISAYLAVSSGSAAEDEVSLSPAASDVFEAHEASAKNTRNIFTVVTVLFAVALMIGTFAKSGFVKGAAVAFGILTFAAYAWGAQTIVNTGHLGARLVHDYGVHAPITPGFVDSTAVPGAPVMYDDKGDKEAPAAGGYKYEDNDED